MFTVTGVLYVDTVKIEMGVNQALDDYYEILKGRVGSPSTVKGHVGRLEDWRRWIVREMGDNPYLHDIADDRQRYMERYFNRLRPPAYGESTFNNFRQYFVQFWTYARGRGWVDTNPMLHIDPRRVPQKERLRLSPAELIEALEGATPRDRVALAIAMNTALRAGDIMTMTVGKVDLYSNNLSVWVEKSDRWVPLPITADLRPELIRWMTHYAEIMGVDGVGNLPNSWILVPAVQYHHMFPGKPALGGYIKYKTGKRCGNPELMAQRALERLGHPTKGNGLHVFRRSAAMVAYENAKEDGIPDPMQVPQSLLGHKNRRTTELYLDLTPAQEVRDNMMRGKSFVARAAEAAARRNAELTGETPANVERLGARNAARRDRSA